ncbi:MAG: hypothetical protein M3547_03885 [Acidobacteriota bacterium]|nr:hypothetical protein [Acidobacteriota bacterium]
MTALFLKSLEEREREREKKAFFELADRLAHSSDPSEQKHLKEELARMTFREYAEGPVERPF